MIFDSKPAIIGHRGFGSGNITVSPAARRATEAVAEDTVAADDDTVVAENTIASLLAAAEAGVSWVEIDVQRTADDDLVLRHDPTTADGVFLIDGTAADSGLPRLVDIFAALPPEVAVDVDVKTILEDAVDSPSRRTGALLLPVLAREARRRPLLVTSFDPALLLYLKENLPGVPLGLLTWLSFPLWHGVSAAANLGLQAVGLHTGSFALDRDDTRIRPLEHSVGIAHRAGLEVMAWCPAAKDAARYAAGGVDALVVNDIPGVLSALS
ncbi:glycerophosphodiester phosphodiesterase [Actinomadura alba]|uniref:Glycerophosphodiester phosphodiesterase n=1 Tax=Actinomadura alba TaxID=406431 RepID=A0ABR7LJ16_9ACTN|nr:glycerophosphodiester phosphodiesterase [Actinomadura alba]MBC6464745.1 glycerophosphodiester phosphodiesterase [Actinomadura alba]